MASNHVSSDQVPLQGQSIYTDPSYQHLFSPADRYGNPSWEAQLQQQPGLALNNAPTQTWQQGAFSQQAYNTFGQPYGTQPHSFQTSSPYQYGQFGQQAPANPYVQSANGEPSLAADSNALRQHQPSPYRMPMRTTTPQNQPGTVTPQALQHGAIQVQNVQPSASPFQVPQTVSEQPIQRAPSVSFIKPVPVPSYEIPKGKKSGGLYVLDQATLTKATQSTPLNKLVTLGLEPFHLATNRTALPLYTARQSVRELKKAGADNKKLLAKLSSSRPSVAKALKTKTYAGSPSAPKREVSDSDSYTDSSDEDSEYTDDEDDEPSPLPAARPEEPHGAVRYDIIKAVWYPPKSAVSSEKIRVSMREIHSTLTTIRDRWRADSKAVSEAEEKKKTGELPVLKSRVASQRDLLQSALQAILDHAHPDVLYNLGHVKPFLYISYQFLANRHSNKDYDGPLTSVILEVLSRCGNLTPEDLEATRLNRALNLIKKHANEKHKALIQQTLDSSVANSKKSKVGSPSQAEPVEEKAVKRPAPESSNRSATESSKKLKPTEAPLNTVKKTIASTTSSKPTSTTATSLAQKKPGERPASAPALVKARVNQVTNKPSGIFASLNAASKKPAAATSTTTTTKNNPQAKATATAAKDKKSAASGPAPKPAFSFAQTMASLLKPKEQEAAPVKTEKQLPAETPEEKAKRLRKEARRHLRVTFKPDAALVQIKYFSHDPEEEMGHDENFVRDAGDIGGEGRMFKQHKELEVDDDDDDDEPEIDFQPWKEPTLVDFSGVAQLTQSNYAPYGGGLQIPDCPEKNATVARENATLMVFYADPNDIPSSPREPLEQAQDSAPAVTVKMFGEPPESVRGKSTQAAPQFPADLDLGQLENIFKQFANPGTNDYSAGTQPESAPMSIPAASTYAPPTAAPAAPTDIQSILSALQTTAATQAQPPSFPTQAPMPPMPQALPLPGDFNAIMAAIQAAGAGNGLTLPPPPPGLPPGFPPFPMPFQLPPQQADATAFQPQYQQPQEQQYNASANGGVKRQRDDGNNNDRGAGKKHKNRGERPHKVLPCRFFQKGTCNKGDNCTYVHDLNM